MKVLKFGGTSMANADTVKRVADIVNAESVNRFVVVSAPGKRDKQDTKVTDMLYALYEYRRTHDDCTPAFEPVVNRFSEIADKLELFRIDGFDLKGELEKIKYAVDGGADRDYVASRGEYLSAYMFAHLLNRPFADAKEIIRFDASGNFDEKTTFELCAKKLDAKAGAVIPGFYGGMPNGAVKTFSRGGSDVTGAIIAGATGASVYENWTDVDGFLSGDPKVVDGPRVIDVITYRELRELSYMGAAVLHPESIFPVRKRDIPIRIRNTFNPGAKGTLIVPTEQVLSGKIKREELPLTGIAGKKDFLSVQIEKSMMNNEKGFARKVLSVLEEFGLSLEHMPSGIDTLSVVIDKHGVERAQIDGMLKKLNESVSPDRMEVIDNIALIAVVGHGMNRRKGMMSAITGALYEADVNIRMIDQGSSELNIIIAVENCDYEKAIRALHGLDL
ncbi:MAG: aspartate kinase [Clostridia bacterium]|jgi:aspartate kinase|nr:aspartate kinase [Clostridia bacterium]